MHIAKQGRVFESNIILSDNSQQWTADSLALVCVAKTIYSNYEIGISSHKFELLGAIKDANGHE